MDLQALLDMAATGQAPALADIPDDALAALLDEAINAARSVDLAASADAIAQKQAIVEIAKAVKAEQISRAEAAGAVAQANDALEAELDGLAATDTSPAADDGAMAADPSTTAAAEAPEEPATVAPAVEPVVAAAEPVAPPAVAEPVVADAAPEIAAPEGAEEAATTAAADPAEPVTADAAPDAVPDPTNPTGETVEPTITPGEAIPAPAPFAGSIVASLTPTRRTASIRAAEQNFISGGTELDTEALANVVRRTMGDLGNHGDKIVASVRIFAEDAPVLSSNYSEQANAEILRSYTERRAAQEAAEQGRHTAGAQLVLPGRRTAAYAPSGIFCGPPTWMDQAPVCVNDATPVIDIFGRQVPIDGDICYERQVAIPAGATGSWTAADQAAIDPADPTTWKPCADYSCTDTTVCAVPFTTVGCLQLSEFQVLNTKRTADVLATLGSAFARNAEAKVLGRLKQLAINYSFESQFGAEAGVAEMAGDLFAGVDFAGRLLPERWVAVVSPGVIAQVRKDAYARGLSMTSAEARGALEAIFADFGVGRVVEALDDRDGLAIPTLPAPPAPGGATIGLPSLNSRTFWAVFVPVDSMFLGRREIINIRLASSPTLARQNKRMTMVETIMAVEQDGCHSPMWVDMQLCASGTRGGLMPVTNPFDCSAVDHPIIP